MFNVVEKYNNVVITSVKHHFRSLYIIFFSKENVQRKNYKTMKIRIKRMV